MLGRTLAHFEIVEKLGEGGMGLVYKARDTHLDRFVALKLLRTEAMSDPDRKLRFIQEAKAASALNHPNIITIHDISQADGVDFMAMEFISGRTLDSVIGRKGISVGDALRYAVAIADGLAAAHGAGIVHRDLKPSNIMVNERDHVKILDFGLAKLADPEPRGSSAETETIAIGERPATEAGLLLGTAAFMSPEQAEGRKVDSRSDIFAFGAVLYQMLTGQRAFQGSSKLSTLSAILREDPKPVSQVAEGIPRELERLVARCLKKQPGQRFQHMDDVKILLQELKEESDSGSLSSVLVPAAALSPVRRWALPALAAAALILAAAFFWRMMQAPKAPEHPRLTRLTSDSGLTRTPAISPDGKLVAYASDRGGKGNLDIWVQQVAGGEPLQLTRDEADDHQPDFSPDGTTLAFRSEREGGGIYTMSALGGEPRRIVEAGYRPRFSPDSRWIAYWVGRPGGAPNATRVIAVPASGGTPRLLHPEGVDVGEPIWSPDGKSVLFRGVKGYGSRAAFWLVPVDGGSAQQIEIPRLGEGRAGQGYGPWIGDHLYLSVATGESTNLWRAVFKGAAFGGEPQQLTFGTSEYADVSASLDGRIVFSSLTSNRDIWALPIDANQGKATGPVERLTQDAGADVNPAFSPDGRKLVFVSSRSGGNSDLWSKDLETGKETALVLSPAREFRPVFSPDGLRIGYTVLTPAGRDGYLIPAKGGATEKICEDCNPWDFSLDSKMVVSGVGYAGRVRSLDVMDLATRRKAKLAAHATHTLVAASFSPDNHWVAFAEGTSSRTIRVVVAPFQFGTEAPESQWIPVTDDTTENTIPRWSPDGNLVYYFSDRDGFRCIWARRLAAGTKKPAGDPIAVYHSHTTRLSLRNEAFGSLALAISHDKLAFTMNEQTGNIWMMQPK